MWENLRLSSEETEGMAQEHRARNYYSIKFGDYSPAINHCKSMVNG